MQQADRFWSKVSGGDIDGCWTWNGAQAGGGYGDFYVGTANGKKLKAPAHRWAYEELRADIPTGLQLDHLCRNRACVNPWHLEPVTHAVNVHRGERSQRGHCPQGHPYSAANTYIAPRGDRQCRTCIRDRNYQTWKKTQALAQSKQITIQQARREMTNGNQ